MIKTTGKFIKKLELQKGTSKAGREWQKQSYIFEQQDKYNTLICVDVDETHDLKRKMFKDLELGKMYDVYINISSREWNGKYFTNINGWKIEEAVKDNYEDNNDNNDDLPF